MLSREQTPAYRRYQRRAAVGMGLYVVSFIGVTYLLKHWSVGDLRYALALLPGICVSAVIVALGRYVAEESDEYQRFQIVLRILWGTGATLVLATIWGFLEALADLPHVPAYWAAIAWFFFFGVASCATRWRAR